MASIFFDNYKQIADDAWVPQHIMVNITKTKSGREMLYDLDYQVTKENVWVLSRATATLEGVDLVATAQVNELTVSANPERQQ